MRLIQKILSRKQRNKASKIKASLSYIQKTHEALKESVKAVERTSKRLQEREKLKDSKSIEVRLIKSKLGTELKKLDKAVEKYYKIDEFRKEYTDKEKMYLGELKKYWHSIKLTIPSSQWKVITELLTEYNLENAKTLVTIGNLELSYEQFHKESYRS